MQAIKCPGDACGKPKDTVVIELQKITQRNQRDSSMRSPFSTKFVHRGATGKKDSGNAQCV